MAGIIICGLNGSGKSTLGKELAKHSKNKLEIVEGLHRNEAVEVKNTE